MCVLIHSNGYICLQRLQKRYRRWEIKKVKRSDVFQETLLPVVGYLTWMYQTFGVQLFIVTMLHANWHSMSLWIKTLNLKEIRNILFESEESYYNVHSRKIYGLIIISIYMKLNYTVRWPCFWSRSIWRLDFSGVWGSDCTSSASSVRFYIFKSIWPALGKFIYQSFYQNCIPNLASNFNTSPSFF